MMRRVIGWYRGLKWGWRAGILTVLGLAGLSFVYIGARSLQYIGASRASAGIFTPAGADAVFRISNGRVQWDRIQKTDFWKTLRKKTLKDPAVRKQINAVLAEFKAPTLDELDDDRWIERNPMLGEDSILTYGGRDVMAALRFDPKATKFCVATRLGFGHFLLTPAAGVFSGLIGAKKTSVDGLTVLQMRGLNVAIRGAMVIASNDLQFLREALRERGSPVAPSVPLTAVLSAEPFKEMLTGFPAGGFLVFANFERLTQLKVEIDVAESEMLVRMTGEGVQPWTTDEAPSDVTQMIPTNGVGAILTNTSAVRFWDWVVGLGDPKHRNAKDLNQFAYENFHKFIDILTSQKLGEKVISKLEGPASIVFGATEGSAGLTFASAALYLRSADPRGAAESLQQIIDAATRDIKDKLKPVDEDIGGYSLRSYPYSPDIFKINDYLCASYGVTSDALVIGNNFAFMKNAMACLANQESQLIKQLHYEQAIRRLQKLGMKKVFAPGATASAWFFGPRLREGLEGFYPILAKATMDNDKYRDALMDKIEKQLLADGQNVSRAVKDDMHARKFKEELDDFEQELRARARILDYIRWVAFQAEPAGTAMKLELALSLK